MWTSTVLAEDADLTSYERRMPDAAKSYKGSNATNAFDGKRELAKRDIGKRLVRMGVAVDELSEENILTLNQTAVYRELALIFHDLSDTTDSIAHEKAVRYDKLYEESWIDVSLALTVPAQSSGITNIPLHRA